MTLKGTAVSPGVVVGKVYRYERFVPTFSSESPESTASELAHYLEACRLARGGDGWITGEVSKQE